MVFFNYYILGGAICSRKHYHKFYHTISDLDTLFSTAPVCWKNPGTIIKFWIYF